MGLSYMAGVTAYNLFLCRVMLDRADNTLDVDHVDHMETESPQASPQASPPPSYTPNHTPSGSSHTTTGNSYPSTPLARQQSEIIASLVTGVRVGGGLMRSQSVQVVAPSQAGGDTMANSRGDGEGLDARKSAVRQAPPKKRLEYNIICAKWFTSQF